MKVEKSKKFNSKLFVVVLSLFLIGGVCAYYGKLYIEEQKFHEEVQANIEKQTFEFGDEDAFIEYEYKDEFTPVNEEDLKISTEELTEGSKEIEFTTKRNKVVSFNFPYEVVDTQFPELSGVKDVTVLETDKYKPKVKAVDPVDGELKVKYEPEVDFSKPGKYKIKASAVDSNGNKTEETFTVHVKEKPKPQPQPKPNTGSGRSATSGVSVTFTKPAGGQSSSGGSGGSKPRTRTDWMWSLINSLPEPVRRGLKGATIVDSLGGNYAGMTYPNTMTIKIANWIKDSTFHSTVMHEMGHIYHLRTGLDRTAEWQEIYQAEWVGKGYYGSANAMEAFADTIGSMYAPGKYNSIPLDRIPRSVAFMKKYIDLGV